MYDVADVKYGRERTGLQENLRRWVDMSGGFNIAPMSIQLQTPPNSIHRPHCYTVSLFLSVLCSVCTVSCAKLCVCVQCTVCSVQHMQCAGSGQRLPTFAFREQFSPASTKPSWGAAPSVEMADSRIHQAVLSRQHPPSGRSWQNFPTRISTRGDIQLGVFEANNELWSWRLVVVLPLVGSTWYVTWWPIQNILSKVKIYHFHLPITT